MIRKIIAQLTTTHAESDDGENDDGDPPRYVPPKVKVMRLIIHNEGSVWQSDLVEECEWSAAKTSRLLSDMERDGQIRRTEIGREKVVFAAGKQPGENGDDRL